MRSKSKRVGSKSHPMVASGRVEPTGLITKGQPLTPARLDDLACLCHRCGYAWMSRKIEYNHGWKIPKPKKCPHCNNPNWWRVEEYNIYKKKWVYESGK